MTEIITIDALPDVASKPSKRVGASRILNRFLGPAKAYHANLTLLERHGGDRPFSLSVAEKVRPRALERYRSIPPVAHLHCLSVEFWQAATLPIDEPMARVMMGILLDGLRVKPSDATATYIDLAVDGLTDEIGSLDRREYVAACSSPFVVSWVIRTLVRETKFQPDISDLLGMCRSKQWTFRGAAMAMENLIEFRSNAEDILEITGDLVDDGAESPF